VVTVRPYCRSEDYWQVYFDTNRVITELYSRATVVA
jgi:small conductance mechanosensitive channel